MLEINIKIDNMELRTNEEEDIIGEVVLHTKNKKKKDEEILLAEWKENQNGFEMSTVPAILGKDDNYDPQVLVKLMKIMTFIISQIYLDSGESLRIDTIDGEKVDGEGGEGQIGDVIDQYIGGQEDEEEGKEEDDKEEDEEDN